MRTCVNKVWVEIHRIIELCEEGIVNNLGTALKLEHNINGDFRKCGLTAG
jgi:hypothetical protein